MKKVFFTVLVLGIAFSIGNCNKSVSTDGAKSDKLVVGVSLPTQREEHWVRMANDIQSELEKLGVTVLLQISDNDAARQQSQCENLLSQGINVLVIGCHDMEAAGNIVNLAHEEDVPVLSLERLIMNADVDLYVSFNQVIVGETLGQWFVENAPQGNIVLLSGDALDNNARLVKQGVLNKLQPKIDNGTYTLVMDQSVKDWAPDNAMKLAEDALTANRNNIVGFIAPNDGIAGGIIQALAAQGMDGKIPVTGQDFELAALKRIVEGTQGMTAFKDTRIQCAAAAKAAVSLANRARPEGINLTTNNGFKDVPSIALMPSIVTKDNIQQVVEESGLYTWAEITN
jgi:D-xylose transport system substrate-binding protein